MFYPPTEKMTIRPIEINERHKAPNEPTDVKGITRNKFFDDCLENYQVV